MAMTYQNFASLGVNLNRQKYGPLDISNVFTSENDLKYYLTKGAHTEGVSEYWYKNANEKVVPYPYEGQVLATVINGVVNVYALALDADGAFVTQEIAGKIEVDGSTIKLNDAGELELVGLPTDVEGKTYVPSYVNGVLTWAEPDTSTAEGQAQEIEGLKTRTATLELTVNGKGEGEERVDGLVDLVADNAQAIVDEAAARDAADKVLEGKIADVLQAAKDYADANDADTVYDDSDLQTRVKALEDEERYDDTALSNRVSDLEDAINGTDEIDGLEARVAAMEVFWDAAEDSDGIVNKLKEIQDYIESDESGAAEMAGHIQDNADAIAVLNGDAEGSVNKKIADAIEPLATTEALNGVKATAEAAATKEYTDAELAKKVDKEAYETDKATFAVASEVADTYVTKAAFEAHEEDIENELLAYAKTAEVNAELARKVASGTIAHTTEEVAEGVSVNGTVMNIVVDAFTKAETRQYVADTISQMTGGESAADVLLALNNYKSDNDARVGAIETKNTEQDASIAAVLSKAEQGIADAAKVAADLVTANGNITSNTNEIAVVKGTITTVNETLSGKITALENKDIELAGLISGLDTAVKGHATTIGEHAAAITALQTKDTELAGQISAVDAKFASYYDKDTVDEKVKAAVDAIPEVDFTPYATNEYVGSELAKKANAADVYTKDEANTEFMTQDEVDARINALIVAADPEGGKTITDIQNLVKYVDENAGEIAALVTSVGENSAKLSDVETAIADHAAKLATMVIPKASTEVTVADDGTLGIGEISTDKLVQGSKTLVLFGGDAEVSAAE
jgi:hypothetical protein